MALLKPVEIAVAESQGLLEQLLALELLDDEVHGLRNFERGNAEEPLPSFPSSFSMISSRSLSFMLWNESDCLHLRGVLLGGW